MKTILQLREEKDQANFLKLAVNGFKAMAKANEKFKNKDLYKLSKKASLIANKGFEAFQTWFQSLDKGDKLVLAGELSFYTKQKDKTIEKMLKYKFEGKNENEVCINKDNNKVICKVNKLFYRPSEVDLLKGDYSKAKKELNWEPKTNLKKLVELMTDADYQRNKSGTVY